MKKYLPLLLVVLLLLSGCGRREEMPPPVDQSTDSSAQAPGSDQPPFTGEDITVEDLIGNLIVTIPDGWEAVPVHEEWGMGLRIRPEGQEGYMTVWCSGELMGVCGTGLEQRSISLPGGGEASLGFYDDNSMWTYLFFPEKEGNLWAEAEPEAESWWDDFMPRALEILHSARVELPES